LDEAFILPFAEGAGQQAGPEVIHSRVSGANWDDFGMFAHQDILAESVSIRPPRLAELA
jgi:hypothetical protein